jgi:hypothetical protein
MTNNGERLAVAVEHQAEHGFMGIFSEGSKNVGSFGGAGYFSQSMEKGLALDLSRSLPLVL